MFQIFRFDSDPLVFDVYSDPFAAGYSKWKSLLRLMDL